MDMEFQQLLTEAQRRWLQPSEVCQILRNHLEYSISTEPPDKPSSGSLFLFDRRVLRHFRRDGHNWRKKKDGKTVKEAHEKLKVKGVDVFHSYYALGEENECFQRRSYWLLEEDFAHIVLVHYLEVKLQSEDKLFNESSSSSSMFQSSCISQDSAAVDIKSSAVADNKTSANSTVTDLEGVNANCLVLCGIFPKEYEIDQDTLIQLLMATGFITDEQLEDIDYLQVLVDERFIQVLREDVFLGKVWYTITRFTDSGELLSRLNHVKLDGGNWNPAFSTGEPCHVTVQQSTTDFEVLKRFTEMRTLLFLRGHESCFQRVPYDFFALVKHLEILDLSDTRLIELPSSIGIAKSLRFLNLSGNLIKQLPGTIQHLTNLQTLKLRKCPHLVDLPKGLRKLINLRHLDFDTPSRLGSLPPGMGTLTNLQTLSEFPVGSECGCSVGELKNMNKLRGRFCLSRLENEMSLDEVKAANLGGKEQITGLELRWSLQKRRNTSLDDELIQYLKPHMNICHLLVLNFGGTMFPSWISDPYFRNLVSITLFKCENCRLLPSLGQLPSLRSLSLYELSGISVVDVGFYRGVDIADASDVCFPKLQKLEIISMLSLVELRDPEKSDFPSLVEITVKDCLKLVSLLRLSYAPSLKYMEINNCPSLPSLPEVNLSIETLIIEGCPLLSSRYSREIGQDWDEIAHLSNVFIDQTVPSSLL